MSKNHAIPAFSMPLSKVGLASRCSKTLIMSKKEPVGDLASVFATGSIAGATATTRTRGRIERTGANGLELRPAGPVATRWLSLSTRKAMLRHLGRDQGLARMGEYLAIAL